MTKALIQMIGRTICALGLLFLSSCEEETPSEVFSIPIEVVGSEYLVPTVPIEIKGSMARVAIDTGTSGMAMVATFLSGTRPPMIDYGNFVSELSDIDLRFGSSEFRANAKIVRVAYSHHPLSSEIDGILDLRGLGTRGCVLLDLLNNELVIQEKAPHEACKIPIPEELKTKIDVGIYYQLDAELSAGDTARFVIDTGSPINYYSESLLQYEERPDRVINLFLFGEDSFGKAAYVIGPKLFRSGDDKMLTAFGKLDLPEGIDGLIGYSSLAGQAALFFEDRNNVQLYVR